MNWRMPNTGQEDKGIELELEGEKTFQVSMLPYTQEGTLAQHSDILGLIQYFLQHDSFFFLCVCVV